MKNKKLLILGASPNEIPLVTRAQELGVYVIVTDYYQDHAVSPAKDFADEYWDVSWSDIDTLERLCKESSVDGVIAGFSEIRVDCMVKLSERLGLPHYVDMEQLNLTKDKYLFKETCRKYSVPVIKEYNVDNVEFPVIVKPVDRGGSIGVGIAHNRDEFSAVYNNALEKSLSGHVIIEDYITDATEFDVHYAINDGVITLLCTDDIVQAKGNSSDGKVIQSAWLYPSKYEVDFLQKVDPYFRNMIEGLGIKDGTIFFSGFVNANSEFAFFECGFRMWGEQEFKYNTLNGLMNYLDLYIYSALGLKYDFDYSHVVTDSKDKIKGFEINLYVNSGRISTLEGFDELSKHPDCTLAIVDGHIGQVCSSDKAILTKSGLIGFASRNMDKLVEYVSYVYDTLHICDEHGNDMLYDHLDPETVKNWWN